jgi:hypothetical protein
LPYSFGVFVFIVVSLYLSQNNIFSPVLSIRKMVFIKMIIIPMLLTFLLGIFTWFYVWVRLNCPLSSPSFTPPFRLILFGFVFSSFSGHALYLFFIK